MVFGSGFPYKLYQTFFLINEFSSSPANIQKKKSRPKPGKKMAASSGN
jgi:hypothetical protein